MFLTEWYNTKLLSFGHSQFLARQKVLYPTEGRTFLRVSWTFGSCKRLCIQTELDRGTNLVKLRRNTSIIRTRIKLRFALTVKLTNQLFHHISITIFKITFNIPSTWSEAPTSYITISNKNIHFGSRCFLIGLHAMELHYYIPLLTSANNQLEQAILGRVIQPTVCKQLLKIFKDNRNPKEQKHSNC